MNPNPDVVLVWNKVFMRSDMGKVVITRPRTNSSYGYGKVRHNRSQDVTKLKNIFYAIRHDTANDDELEDDLLELDTTGVESMRKIYQNNYDGVKEFTDMLGPIERYLHSRIGYRWDDIWSDVCTHLRGGIPVEHVREHVQQMVYFKGGRFSFNYYHNRSDDAHMYGIMFYVDDDGLLQRQIKPPKRQTQYKNYENYRFYKEPDEQVWKLDCERMLRLKGRLSSHLTIHDKEYNKKLKNFLLFIADGVEFVFIKNAWFKFDYIKVNESQNLDVSVKRDADDNIISRTIYYSCYDILGNLSERNVVVSNANITIRHKLLQVRHEELKRVGLIS